MAPAKPRKWRRPVKGFQRCGRCGRRGHNAMNPKCPERIADAEKSRALGELAHALDVAADAARRAAAKVKP